MKHPFVLLTSLFSIIIVISEDSVNIGEWFAVIYDSQWYPGNKLKVYINVVKDGIKFTKQLKSILLLLIVHTFLLPGVVEAVTSTRMAEINFMERRGKKYFAWPFSADKQMVEISTILCKMVAPVPISPTLYQFDEKTINSVNNCFTHIMEN